MKLSRRLSLLRYRARSVLERVAEAPRSAAEPPRLSVAVIAQDCVAELAALVENVRDVACEVIVVDGGSSDASLEYCRSDPLIKVSSTDFYLLVGQVYAHLSAARLHGKTLIL